MSILQSSPTHLLHRAKQRADENLTSQLTSVGLTPRQFAILYSIYCSPGLNQTEITRRTGSDRSTTAELVNRLERNGLVKRDRSERDARTLVVTLTSQGNHCVEMSMPAVNSADASLLSLLPEEKRAQFVDALVTIGMPLD